MKRLLLGGSFDPPHRGHRELADLAAAHFGMSRVDFVPALMNPLKNVAPTPAVHRLALLDLLLEGRHGILSWEIERSEPSYTLLTVRQAARKDGERPIWLMGADALTTLEHWYEVDKLFQEAHLQLVSRRGVSLKAPPGLVARVGAQVVENLIAAALPWAPQEVSSSQLRAQLACGEEPEALTATMMAYIRRHGLYGM